MLNTLANQGFIHRDGRNITREALAQGFIDSLNFDPTLASAMFDNAIMANPKENATDFDLYGFSPFPPYRLNTRRC